MLQPQTQSSHGDRLKAFWQLFHRIAERPLADLLVESLRNAAHQLEQSQFPNRDRELRAAEVVSCIKVAAINLAESCVDQCMNTAEQWPVKSDEPSVSSLSVLSNQDTEQVVSADIAVRTIAEQVSLELAQLHTIFRNVTERPINDQSNPVGPKFLIMRLQEGMRDQDVSQAAINEFLPDLALALTTRLKRFYRHLITQSEEQGLDSEPATDTRPSSTVEVEASPATTEEIERVSEKDMLLSLFNISERAQSSEQHRAFNMLTKGLAARPSGVRIDHEDLLTILGRLQHQKSDPPEAQNEKLITAILKEAKLNPNLTDVLADEDRAYIDITQRFMDAVLSASSFKQVLRDQVYRLRWIILQVLLQDESFFMDRAQPARYLLDSLGRLSFRITSDRNLERWLTQFADKLIQEYQGSNETFTNLSKDIDSLVERQDQAFHRIQSRIAKTAQAQQQLRDARQAVATDIAKVLLDAAVPTALERLLYDVDWRHQMIVHWLRSNGGDIYKQSLKLLEEWLQHLNGSPDPATDPEGLKTQLREELSSISGTRVTNCLALLESQIDGETAVETRHFTEDYLADKEAPYRDDRKPDDAQSNGLEPGYTPSKRMSQLTPGDWVVFSQNDGNEQFLRLTWRGGPMFHFSGVSEAGPRDIEVHFRTLNTQLRTGEARILAEYERPLVDLCVHQVAHSFYEDMVTDTEGDALTGALTRMEFERKLEQHVQNPPESGEHYYLLYIDIDRFRVINTTLGHAAGDRALKDVAQKLRHWTQEPERVGRLGGNEFGVLVKADSKAMAASLADGWREQMSQQTFRYQDNTMPLTVSIGIDRLRHESLAADRALSRSALACQAVKERGGNSVDCFEADNEEQTRQTEQMNWLAGMDRGLDELLVLRCQPIFSLSDASAFPHYEILLGVKTPDGQVQPPAAFIEAIEHHKRMAQVDCWVINAVFDWIEANPEKMQSIAGFSINLSGRSITDDRVLEYVLAQLTRRELDTRKICFEITETSAISSLATANDFISEIKRFGCKFSLDDFGTGLSSYAYLQNLDVDFLKIDGIFIRNIVHNTKDQALVCSIVELAQFMGLKTIAEFVEDAEVCDYLTALGVDEGQGYYLGKPVLL